MRAALAEPDRHPQPVAGGPRAPGGAGVEGVDVAEAEQVHEVGGAGDLAGGGLASGRRVTVCSGASRRANASAVARSHWSASARTGSSRSRTAWTGCLPSSSGPASSSSRSRDASSSSSQRAGRSSTVTPCRPSGGITWLPGGSWAPSVTSRMWGVGGRSSAPNRGRSLRSGGSRAAISASDVVTIRIGPTASDCWALWACGSHFTQSQWVEVALGGEHRDGEVVGGVERGRRADHRPGERADRVLLAAQLDPVEGPQVDARRAASAAAGARRAAGAGRRPRPGRPGRSGRSPAARARARAAGSRRRTGRAGSWRRSWRAPTPATAPRPATGRACGSGWCQFRARRCWSAASRATWRTLPR